MQKIKIKNFFIGRKEPLCIISGPCVIESEQHTLDCAFALKTLCEQLKINFIFKASYDKANRSSYSSFRGPGLKEGLRILGKVKETLAIPILTDIHAPQEAEAAAAICDILQIPAFLCRQTDLLKAAGNTCAVVNIKKGQFMAPWEMQNAIEKVKATGNQNIILTDRGTSFGYNNLVSDFRAIPIMQDLGFPVCFDASHSVQLPGGHGSSTNAQRKFIPYLAKAAIAVGSNCLYLESHTDPSVAKSDKDSVMLIADLEKLFRELLQIYSIVNI